MTTVEDHFGFTQLPFDKAISDQNLWLPPSKKHLVDTICHAIDRRQNLVLTGEPGVGKTCVLRAVRHRLSDAEVRLTYCHNATLSRRDFYRQLCIALDLSPSATAAALFHAVSTHVTELGRDRIHPVLILDEAQLLRPETLEHLHILLNYGWDAQPLLSLVLVGLPELEDRLRLRRNRALYTRLSHRLRIDPLSVEDCADYIAVRLEDGGCKKEIFTRDAISMICEASYGTLREIDRICQTALLYATDQGRTLIERNQISEVLKKQENLP